MKRHLVSTVVAVAVACLACPPGDGGSAGGSATGDASPPTVPAALSATATSTTSVLLTWSAASDDRGVAGYRCYRGGVAYHDTAQTTYADHDVAPGSTHCYRVLAFDAAGNESGLSAEACATVPASGFNLTVGRSGAGSGTVTGTGISCGTDCSESYASGTTVTLTASAASGSTFAGWTGCDAPSDATCTMTMTSEKSVTAAFDIPATSYTLSVAMSWGRPGTATITGPGISCPTDCAEAYASGTEVTVTASPGTGYALVGWVGCDATSGMTCTVTMAANRTVTAQFRDVPRYTLTVNRTGAGTGSVSSSPAGISCGTDCSEPYASGTAVTLTASAASGSTFAGWTGCDGPSDATCTVTMTSEKTVAAAFDASSQLCTPGATRCTAGDVTGQQRCNAAGTGWTPEACPAWSLCTSSKCRYVCEAQAGTPSNPSVCFVPSKDGVNDGILYYTTAPGVFVGGSTIDARAYSQLTPPAVAPVFSSDREWPYAWWIGSGGQVNVQFTLNQFGAGERTVGFYFGVKRSNTISEATCLTVGASSGGSTFFWTNNEQPLSLFWLDSGWWFDAHRASWNYSGGGNLIALSPNSCGISTLDPIDVEYVLLEVAP